MRHEYLERAIELAGIGMAQGHGGPFGAVVVRGDQVLAEAFNQVTGSHDPTAHAEVGAIRAACRTLGTFSLAGCEIYSSCEPCPMCLSAIYWARLDEGSDYRRVPFILAHVTIDFRSEALVSEVLEAGIRMDWIGTKSFAFAYQIWEKSSRRTVSEATTVHVCYDYQSKHTLPVPDALRLKIEAFEGRPLARRP